ncbi:hypothetical protein D917_10350 [Trichinella nativa]|uniref:Uncharacterized protein n=1 Tax=Trichinella nativa TaxID=6335 RepID=A0A1Y3EGF0_9BILA|nr:hypothetical protein D917_10350 [Trichinella nativa]
MHVGRLQGFDGKITSQGKLLHQGLVVYNSTLPLFKRRYSSFYFISRDRNLINVPFLECF